MEQLSGWLTGQDEIALFQRQVVEWAMQSHDHARDHAYKFPADKGLDEAYVNQALPVIEAQLARALVTLAALLNHALGNVSAH